MKQTLPPAALEALENTIRQRGWVREETKRGWSRAATPADSRRDALLCSGRVYAESVLDAVEADALAKAAAERRGLVDVNRS